MLLATAAAGALSAGAFVAAAHGAIHVFGIHATDALVAGVASAAAYIGYSVSGWLYVTFLS